MDGKNQSKEIHHDHEQQPSALLDSSREPTYPDISDLSSPPAKPCTPSLMYMGAKQINGFKADEDSTLHQIAVVGN